jgi:hypothetical protein
VYSEDCAANHWHFKEDCVGCATPAKKPSTIDAIDRRKFATLQRANHCAAGRPWTLVHSAAAIISSMAPALLSASTTAIGKVERTIMHQRTTQVISVSIPA